MTHSAKSMLEACHRLKAFCHRHHHPAASKQGNLQSARLLADKVIDKPSRVLAMRKSLLSGAHLFKKSI